MKKAKTRKHNEEACGLGGLEIGADQKDLQVLVDERQAELEHAHNTVRRQQRETEARKLRKREHLFAAQLDTPHASLPDIHHLRSAR